MMNIDWLHANWLNLDWCLDWLLSVSGPQTYLGIFGILLICGLGLPVPEDLTLFAAGLSAYYGTSNLGLVILISYLGVIVGDSITFYLGAVYGPKLTKKWFFGKLLPEERLTMVKSEFRKKGNHLIFAARFMPGIRAPMYFSAGTLHLPFRVFLFYDGLAALISVPTIIGAVYYFGDELDRILRLIKKVEHSIIFLIIAIVLAVVGKWYIGHRKLKRRRA